MPDLEIFQSELNYHFRDIALLRLALTHPSVAYEQGATVPHNQRLEFLGDAVLSVILTRELYEKFPGVEEGPLTKARAQMVNRRTLAGQAQRLGLGRQLFLSRGEELNEGQSRPSTLADAYEALIGAIFLDGGLEAAREFVLRNFREAFGELAIIPNLDNPKGELQEILQANSMEAPRYEMISATGPDHDREFDVRVEHGGVELGRGKGKSKKEAESAAALAALKTVQKK